MKIRKLILFLERTLSECVKLKVMSKTMLAVSVNNCIEFFGEYELKSQHQFYSKIICWQMSLT